MELTTKISNYYENLRRKNSEIHEKRLEEIYKKIPEVMQIDGLIRDLALRAVSYTHLTLPTTERV